MMQFIDIPTFGEASVMTLAQTDKPITGEGELLVKVSAIGVNRADILQRQGKYPAPKGESEILGLEVCGEVVGAAGSELKQQWLGKEVFGLVAGGAYAEYCVLRAEHAFELPANLSCQQGAAVAEVFLTAYQALVQIGGLDESVSTVLIHAGASGVGTAAIQLAKARGATVIVTVGSEEKKTFCQQLGADLAINYHQEDFVSVIKQHKLAVNLAVDCIAGEYINRDINCLTMDGKIVVLAIMGGRFVESLDMAKMLGKRITIQASTLRNRSDEYKTVLINRFKADFYQGLCAEGEVGIKPVVDKVFDWHDAVSAHEYIQSNRNMGKVVLVVQNHR
ncbi:MAG: NADPH2:quinone reductase [Phenylobacterium sp.]|jgi:NADPH2:quinone reductase